MGERHVRGIAALRNKDTTDSRGVIAWIKGIPTVAQINFNPSGKIHGRVGRGQTDVSDVTGAIARRNVQTTAEGDCKMRVVAANTAAFLVCFERRSGGAGVLIAEDYVICTKSQIACTRAQPSGVPPKSRQASSDSRSVSQ